LSIVERVRLRVGTSSALSAHMSVSSGGRILRSIRMRAAAGITDIDKAPVDAEGLVHFTGILDPEAGRSCALQPPHFFRLRQPRQQADAAFFDDRRRRTTRGPWRTPETAF